MAKTWALKVRWLRLMFVWNSSNGGCRNCGEHHYGPVVRDAVWMKIKPDNPGERDYALCLACMEERLGRKIEVTDLRRDLPWNSYRSAYFNTYRRVG